MKNGLTTKTSGLFSLYQNESLYETIHMKVSLFSSHVLVQTLNSPFFRPHIGVKPRAGEKRAQDNLRAHAQNEPIKNYHAACVNVSRNTMSFTARALNKTIFFDVDIVVKK